MKGFNACVHIHFVTGQTCSQDMTILIQYISSLWWNDDVTFYLLLFKLTPQFIFYMLYVKNLDDNA